MSGKDSASAIFVEDRDIGAVARFDPRVRLAAALVFLLTLATLRTPLPLACALVIGVIAAISARLPFHSTVHRLAEIEGFLVLLLVSLPFTMPGSEMFSIFGFPASREGLEKALTIIVRVNAAVLVIAALLSTMGTMRLARAMAGIGIPAKIAHLFQLTVRYIAVFQDEYRRLRRAMQARAFRPGSNRHSWRALGDLIGMLIVRSAERAERVAWAMKCRGFSGSFPDFEQRRIGTVDIAFSMLWAGLVLVLLWLEYAA
ncbi:MAG: cobalt ECF transporter T component CbiQ [Parvibaculaceae bacterium]